MLKLDAMENPFDWPSALKQQWTDSLATVALNRYPDASADDMRSSFRQAFAVPDQLSILFGNGSDELIQLLLLALHNDYRRVLAPEPTFVMYRFLSEILEYEFIGVPLQNDFSLDLPAMLSAIEQHQPGIVFIAWPNNPTGVAYDETELEAIIAASPGLVVIDEAYHAFAERTMLDRISEFPNVLLMRTLSKLGLAGLRIGALIGSPQWINEIDKIRLPYNLGSLNQHSVNFITEHMDVLLSQAQVLKQQRTLLFDQLQQISAIQVWPSNANFILFKTVNKPAKEVHTELLQRKILIKNLSQAHPLLQDCLRVTVGTEDENRQFIQALGEILAT